MSASRDSVKKISQRVLLFALICTLVLLLTGGLAVVQAGIGAAWTSDSPGSDLSAGRYAHTSVAFDRKMWVIGGDSSGIGTGLKDVRSSVDGATWTQATPDAGFSARFGHTSVVFNNKMWVIGGYGTVAGFKKDVWSSSDGGTWTLAADNPLFFSGRMYHTSVVSGNKMWVIGGNNQPDNTGLNDVWSSSDGVTWTRATPAAGFLPRYSHTSVVKDGKMWVIGGTYDYEDPDTFEIVTVYLNDVWSSSDGSIWNQVKANDANGFSGRFGHTSVVFDGKMWVIGGNGESGRLNDVWYSSDGVTWTSDTDGAAFSKRMYHSSVVFDTFGTGSSRMWVIGGNGALGLLKNVYYTNTIPDPNNVVQLVGLIIAEQVSSDTSGTAPASKEPGAQGPASPAATEAVTAELPVNNQGVVTEATELQAPDGLATVSIGQGVVALDQAGAPVASVSIDTMAPSEMPDVPQGGAVSFAGIAYEIGPNGAQFSPAISITFTAPPGQVGQDYTVRSYDHVTGTWQDLPTSYDPQTGTVTAEVSHFCCFALFTKTVTTKPVIAATTPAPKQLIPTTIAPPSPTIATTFMGIILWVVNLMVTNPMVMAGIVILAVGIVLIVWKQRRDRLNYRP